jgi:multiple inositol-polyphosphate phosphatase/2,3-bisphosphoglycerate 3-phosphatase
VSKIQKWNTLLGSIQKNLTIGANGAKLREWKSKMDIENAWLLNHVGWREHQHLAQSFKKLNPQIFERRNYTVVSSFKARCVSSARAFIAGLHSESGGAFDPDHDLEDVTDDALQYLGTAIRIDNALLRFFDYCRRYVEWVDDHPRSVEELNKFISGGHVSNIRKEIQNNYQITHLTNKQVVDLYQLTVFEAALFGQSTLTSLFKAESLEVLEYLGDLKHYYKTGYGYSINYRQTAPLLRDMVRIVTELRDNPRSDPRATIYFGHAETIVPLIALLGLFEGPPLTAEGFLLSKHRAFRTSKIAPFGANIAFLVYRKKSENVAIETPDMLLQIAVNEHLVNIPGQQHTVSIDTALEYFNEKIKNWSNDECDDSEMKTVYKQADEL